MKLNKTKPNNDENNSYDRIVAIPMRPFWFHLYVKKKIIAMQSTLKLNL